MGEPIWEEEDRRLATAAYRRYGARKAAVILRSMWDTVPTSAQMWRWSHHTFTDLPLSEERDFFAMREEARRRELTERVADVLDRTLDVYEDKAAEGDALSMQRLAVAGGIFYDKVNPPPWRGGRAGVEVNAGEGSTVQLLVVAPSEIEGAQHRAAE